MITIKKINDELKSVGIPISGYYPPSKDADGGLEVDNKYYVQIAPYCDPDKPIFLDTLDLVEVANFATINDLIKFLMETPLIDE